MVDDQNSDKLSINSKDEILKRINNQRSKLLGSSTKQFRADSDNSSSSMPGVFKRNASNYFNKDNSSRTKVSKRLDHSGVLDCSNSKDAVRVSMDIDSINEDQNLTSSMNDLSL